MNDFADSNTVKLLTAKQRAFYEWVMDFITKHERSPLYPEMQAAFGFKSLGSIHEYLRIFREMGLIARGGRNAIVRFVTPQDLGIPFGLPPNLRNLAFELARLRILSQRDPVQAHRKADEVVINFINHPVISQQWEKIKRNY